MPGQGRHPKHHAVGSYFREQILSGKITVGEQLMPDREIAERFALNKRTVAKGLAELVADGLISRTPGRGSVVLRSEPHASSSNIVGVVCFNDYAPHRDAGHVISEEIIRRNRYPVWVPQEILRKMVSTPDYHPARRMLEQMIGDHPFGMVLDGERFLPFELLKRNRSKLGNLVFLMHYMFEERLEGARYILTDYAAGGRLLGRRLYEKGHRVIGFIGYHQPYQQGYAPTAQNIIYQALCQEFSALGGTVDPAFYERPIRGEAAAKVVREHLIASKVTALCGCSDKSITDLYGLFREMQVRIPEDLSLIGYYDAELAATPEYNLTSVSIRPGELAKIACAMVFDEIPDQEILLAPEIIERKSVMDIN